MIFPYLFHHDAESNLTGTSPSGGGGGLTLSNKIAIGIGVPGALAAIVTILHMCSN
jgi:hypothetical protein